MIFFDIGGCHGSKPCHRALRASPSYAAHPFGTKGAPVPAALILLLCVFCLASCSKKLLTKEFTSNEQVQNSSTELNFDFTTMNANMVYAQVFNMMIEPESYNGKTFCIKGTFTELTSFDGTPVYAVIIKDAFACCTQGIEFKYDFNGAKPSAEQIITVRGTYCSTLTNEGLSYNYLKASSVEF